jgi:glycosyltransferase involved in cell wall biosynthesis
VTADTQKPLVSVIMNCHNGEKYLREAIDSIFHQTYPNLEIIFWDNCSTDHSAKIARSYPGDRLRYFRNEIKTPLGRARNLALEQSRGEFVAFLDCDDVWLPTKTEKQIPLFEDQTVALVYSDCYFFNDAGYQKQLYGKIRPYRGACFDQLLNRYIISLETAVLRRSALDSMDHWFENDFSFIEEYDFFVRIGLHWKIDYAPEILAKWRAHGESLSWRFPETFAAERKSMLIKLQSETKVVQFHYQALREAWTLQNVMEAKALWRMGRGARAREIVSRSRTKSWKGFALYWATFFPSAPLVNLYALLTRAVRPSD